MLFVQAYTNFFKKYYNPQKELFMKYVFHLLFITILLTQQVLTSSLMHSNPNNQIANIFPEGKGAVLQLDEEAPDNSTDTETDFPAII